MSFCRMKSAVINGIEVIPVDVETDLSNGLPCFHMVGYLSAEVKEAEERVRTAIQNSGIMIPPKKTVINLSPGNIRKKGTAFDLPIALSILGAANELNACNLEEYMAVGELSLDGNIQCVHGVLPIAMEAKKNHVKCLIVPDGNKEEAMLVDGLEVLGVTTLSEICEKMKKGNVRGEVRTGYAEVLSDSKSKLLDFSDVSGQRAAKRAAEIAVAGRHNMLMVGPPGGGKSMIAKRIPSILPSMTMEECMQITKIYSITGLLDGKHPLITERPFREVHQTVTKSALIGGGMSPKPGEVTLASGGVLFLDELTEFQKPVLEVLRGPLEEHVVRIVRNQGNYVFPADVMLIAAMNPCPCGNYPDYNKCNCSPVQIQRYLGKISQPFLDRIDICIEVPRVKFGELRGDTKEESSVMIRQRVQKARERQIKRYQNGDAKFNAALTSTEIEKYCWLDRTCEKMMSQAFDAMSLTARTYHKILKVARTIADLDGKEQIQMEHLQEAFMYRNIDKKFWGK